MIYCHSPLGFEGHLVSVEVEIRRGIPMTEIVGLPAGEVKESRERVRAAIRHSGFDVPADRMLINLSPAAVRKRGAAFDLAVAVAILDASGQLDVPLPPDLLVMGELRLDGSVLPVSGILTALLSARRNRLTHVILPRGNLEEASFFTEIRAVPLGSLRELFVAELPWQGPQPFLRAVGAPGTAPKESRAGRLTHADGPAPFAVPVPHGSIAAPGELDFREVRGQLWAKRAVMAAVAGGHHALLLGPPGTGKSMIAQRAPALAPPLSRERSLEATAIHSLVQPSTEALFHPPARAPHQSASLEGLVGGGGSGLPGEISLAHGGLLILDEVLEFGGAVLQGLREPLESGVVRIVRAEYQTWYPARFTLLMTSNLCPCGGLGSDHHRCSCLASEVARYWRRLGEALLDRIEIRAFLPSSEGNEEEPWQQLSADPIRWETEVIRKKVGEAVARQRHRYRDLQFERNGELPPAELGRFAALSAPLSTLLSEKCRQTGLSLRGQHGVLRVARTVADLSGKERIGEEELRFALRLRTQGNLEKILQLG
ncbi:MAG: YifB family Mg chelatase-like AAA ATPase [Spirochaetaceae bacterium]